MPKGTAKCNEMLNSYPSQYCLRGRNTIFYRQRQDSSLSVPHLFTGVGSDNNVDAAANIVCLLYGIV